MTRAEQIQKAADDEIADSESWAFIKGAEWADANPAEYPRGPVIDSLVETQDELQRDHKIMKEALKQLHEFHSLKGDEDDSPRYCTVGCEALSKLKVK